MGTKLRRAAGAVALAAGMMIGGVGLGHALAASGANSPSASSSTSSGTSSGAKGTATASSNHRCPLDSTGNGSSSSA